jgi:2-dehydro-3-deoxyphosphogluconate aldolase/(4S)-4-hydroxy-2-oxoglutarate aldolase
MSQKEAHPTGDTAGDAQRRRITEQIIECGAAAVIRMPEADRLMRVAEAIRVGGITAIEITMTTPGALSVIEEVARRMADDDDVIVGVGSVLDAETARRAIDAGARFVVSPIFKRAIVETAHQHGAAALPGAYSPTEIQCAHEAGADIVKVFPASIAGMKFIKAVRAPMPHLKLMPTGGVSLTNAGDWVRAGACSVGVGSALLDKEAIAAGNFDQLTENARTLRQSIKEARSA